MSSSLTSAAATASASADSGSTVPTKYRPVGVALAIGSGLLIGSSFVFKKKGLLSSQKGHVAGEGVAYLKNPLWITGMTIMILGEICNLVAYSFLEAIIVTPMGALSVVICAMLSHIFLQEKLSLFGWIASIQCILGATILALNGPEEQSVTTIAAFKKLFLAPGFLSYGAVVIAAAVVLALVVAPRWGKKTMLPYIGICSLIGGLSVSCTQGLGACIITSIRGENQFKNWFIYFLLAFVIVTLLTEVYYLNVALALFNTAMVTPTYYVTFTFFTLLTSVILYQGLKASATQIITVVLGFLVICTGIFILQMSKVDPRSLTHLDRRTTLLLQAARAEVDPKSARELERGNSARSASRRRTRTGTGTSSSWLPDVEQQADAVDLESDTDADADDKRTIVEKTEDPGIDALRGTFGAVGTLVRARRRATVLSRARSQASNTSVGAVTENGNGAAVGGDGNEKDGARPGGEKAEFRRGVLGGDVPTAEIRRAASVHFADTGAESAPVMLVRGGVEVDPMAEEAGRIRAQTLPATLSVAAERKWAEDVVREGRIGP